MHKSSVIISFILVFISTSLVYANDILINEQNNNPASQSISVLPNEYIDIIDQSDSIKWFIIDAWTPNDSNVVFYGEPVGEILHDIISTDSIINDVTKNVLLLPESFHNDSTMKESTFMPDFGVLFISSSDSLLVSYSLYCDLCRFQTKQSYYDYDGSDVRDELLILLKEIFPKDKFVRNVTRGL